MLQKTSTIGYEDFENIARNSNPITCNCHSQISRISRNQFVTTIARYLRCYGQLATAMNRYMRCHSQYPSLYGSFFHYSPPCSVAPSQNSTSGHPKLNSWINNLLDQLMDLHNWVVMSKTRVQLTEQGQKINKESYSSLQHSEWVNEINWMA